MTAVPEFNSLEESLALLVFLKRETTEIRKLNYTINPNEKTFQELIKEIFPRELSVTEFDREALKELKKEIDKIYRVSPLKRAKAKLKLSPS